MRGTNAGLMKENNKSLILSMIRRSDFSRADLAKATGLTKATISLLVDEMMQDGLIFDEPAKGMNGVGRHPLILRLCESSRHVIGLGLARSWVFTTLAEIVLKWKQETICREMFRQQQTILRNK